MSSSIEMEGIDSPATGWRLIAGYLGYALMFAGIIAMVPLLLIPVWPDQSDYILCFLVPGIVTVIVGYMVYFSSVRGLRYGHLQKTEESVVITAAWVLAILVFSVPFLMMGDCTVSQAVFETASGLTTTGLSVMDVDACPTIFLLYRSMLHFFGGVGLVLVMVTLVSDGGALRVYNAEGHTDQLLPDMVKSARLIFTLYTGFILFGSFMYYLAGMPAFDSLNISISAVSTGGFAVTSGSIATYHSFAIEAITVLLMIMGGTNFLLSYLLLTGHVREYLQHSENKLMFIVIGASSAIAGLVLYLDSSDMGFLQSLWTALFHVVSVVTTTGFQTVSSFALFPSAVTFLLIILMFMGAEAGSTTGSIKMYRIAVVLKSFSWAMRERFGRHCNVYSHNLNRFGVRSECTDAEQKNVFVFVLLYITLFLGGTFIFTALGHSVQSSAFEFASCLGNVGVSCGLIGESSSPVLLWTGIVGMLLGRLEIIVVFVAAVRLFGRVRNRFSGRRS